MPDTLTGLAPAKINLTLEVGATRPDGYHELTSILQTLALADEVVLEPAAETSIENTGPFAGGSPAGPENLAWRAIDALAGALGREPEPFRIRIAKRIPAAGGLGGGASDAATVLRLLARRWPGVTEKALATAAAVVGSDEPFFLAGGTALVEGRGERVTPLPDLPGHGVVLFIPPDTLPNKTATLFRALDRDGQVDEPTVSTALAKRLPGQVTGADLYNSFERVAFDCFPGLAGLWEQLEMRTGEPIRLAGAGPTLFWIGPLDETDRVRAAAAGLDCTIIPTATAGSLWRR
ncbi:MAG: 4-(cytidine 5'-diphospho)-2-C-methyl-D-erythritol kinase [Chloroflexota bacterium]|nr:4-(cytidine 5'-diphospho)-2-C-methyl-D-erythritol kinase [Chloroflexota bacterium]